MMVKEGLPPCEQHHNHYHQGRSELLDVQCTQNRAVIRNLPYSIDKFSHRSRAFVYWPNVVVLLGR